MTSPDDENPDTRIRVAFRTRIQQACRRTSLWLLISMALLTTPYLLGFVTPWPEYWYLGFILLIAWFWAAPLILGIAKLLTCPWCEYRLPKEAMWHAGAKKADKLWRMCPHCGESLDRENQKAP